MMQNRHLVRNKQLERQLCCAIPFSQKKNAPKIRINLCVMTRVKLHIKSTETLSESGEQVLFRETLQRCIVFLFKRS